MKTHKVIDAFVLTVIVSLNCLTRFRKLIRDVGFAKAATQHNIFVTKLSV